MNNTVHTKYFIYNGEVFELPNSKEEAINMYLDERKFIQEMVIYGYPVSQTRRRFSKLEDAVNRCLKKLEEKDNE